MIMNQIIQQKRVDLLAMTTDHLTLTPSTTDFLAAITTPGFQVIAEVKQKSPSAGILCPHYQPDKIAAVFEKGGAAAISVLTDTPYFGGCMADITRVKAATHLPVLCKDFIIDARQIHYARHHGADAVLLIMRILTLEEARKLKATIETLNMLALIEIFDETDLEKALQLSPKVLMINHRNLDTLTMDYNNVPALVAKIPTNIPIIAASGIINSDATSNFDSRIKALLIGAGLLQREDPAEFIQQLKKNSPLQPQVKICGLTRLEDAQLAESLGAQFLGFIFEPTSPRYIDYTHAKHIISQLKTAKPVGIFVNQDRAEIEIIAKKLNLAAVQIYQITEFDSLIGKVIRCVRIKTAADIERVIQLKIQYPYDYVLLDAYHPKQLGGMGQTFDWTLLPKNLDRCFLAGGINLQNIADALRYHPYAIDLASGVEASPGKKDPVKLAQLFKRIQHGK